MVGPCRGLRCTLSNDWFLGRHASSIQASPPPSQDSLLVKHWTCDRKVASLNPGRISRRFFSLQIYPKSIGSNKFRLSGMFQFSLEVEPVWCKHWSWCTSLMLSDFLVEIQPFCLLSCWWSCWVHSAWCPLKGGRGCLMSPPCLESQGCHLIPLYSLLSCSSA